MITYLLSILKRHLWHLKNKKGLKLRTLSFPSEKMANQFMTDFPNEGQTFCVFLLMTGKAVQFFSIFFYSQKIEHFLRTNIRQYFVGSLIQFYAQLQIEKNSFEILKLCYLK